MKNLPIRIIVALIAFLAANVSAITLTAIWDGGGDGSNWSDPLNWDIDIVPINQGAVGFDVTILVGKTVNFDVAGDNEITNFTLGDSGSSDARLNVKENCNLTIIGSADIFDLIYAEGGNFTSIADPDSLNGTRNRLYALNGSIVTVNDNEFNSSGLNNTNYTILSADGAGSILDISGMTSLNDSFSNTGHNVSLTHTINASNEGNIILSGLQSIYGPNDSESLVINVKSSSTMNMNALETVSHSGGNGRIRFSIDSANLNLPSLSNISSTEMYVTSGGTLEASNSSFTYSAKELSWWDHTILSADGENSVLDLSGMTLLDDSFSNTGYKVNLTHKIIAKNYGLINLSGATKINGPGDTESLKFEIDTEGSINLDSLYSINNSGGFGFTYFTLNENTFTFPSLSNVGFVKFAVNNSTINFLALSTVNSSEFKVSNGGIINASNSSFTYNSSGLNNTNYTILSADGAGSILDISGMTSLNDSFSNTGHNVSLTHTINASNEGNIILSGLQSIYGPNDSESLVINVKSSSTMNMNALETVSHSGGNGRIRFSIDNANLNLPSLSNISSTEMYVTSGGTLEASNSSFTYSAKELSWWDHTILSADGENSVLDLSGMTLLDDSFSNTGYQVNLTHKITAKNYGLINLSGTTKINGPGDTESLKFEIDTEGSINLDSLYSINNSGGFGFTYFTLNENTFTFPSLSNVGFVKFAVNNSTINFLALSTVNSSEFKVSNGGIINASNSSFTYNSSGLNNTNYTILSADGAGSILDISGMTSLNDSFSNTGHNVSLTHTINASNEGNIILSGLQSIYGPNDSESLVINVKSSSTMNMNALETVSHSGGNGRIRFSIDNANLNLPSLSNISSTEMYVTSGGTLEASNSSFTYSAKELSWWDHTILSADGENSVLDLSGMTLLDDSFSNTGYKVNLTHKITAKNYGLINLSGTTKINGPGDTESLKFEIDTEGSISLFSLEQISGSTGYVNFTLSESASVAMPSLEYYNVAGSINATLLSEIGLGSTAFNGGSYHNISLSEGSFLSAQSVSATQPVAITLNSPNDMIEIAGDFALSNKISITNPEAANISVGGDYTYSSTSEVSQHLASSVLYMPGESPQKLEIGGINVDIYTQFLTNDNFGLGQLSIGRCSNRSTVFLADDFDNGNLSGTDSEALYLFGIDGQNGLEISEGSSLYLCYLPTYAMIDGSMTSLIDLLGSQMSIPFDQGTIYLGFPQPDSETNLLLNHQFTNGQLPPTFPDITIGDWKYPVQPGEGNIFDWTVANGTINWIYNSTSFNHYIDFSAALVGDILNPPLITNIGTISQTIDTIPGKKYMLWFDMADYGTGNKIMVSATNDSAEFYCDIAATSEILDGTIPTPLWQSKMWRFTAQGVSTTIAFESINPEADLNVAIDNVYVNYADGYEFKPCNMIDLETISAYWLSPCDWNNCNCESSDINEDGYVDLFDFALLAGNWLDCGGPRTYFVTIDATDGGTVLEPGVGKYSYLGVQEIDIIAQVDDHYSFTGWTGTAVEAEMVAEPDQLSTTLIIDENCTLQANFVIDQHTITISSGDNGSVTSPGTGQFTYDYGTAITVDAVSDDFYHFVEWTGTAVDSGLVNDPSLSSITVSIESDCSLEAVFAINPYGEFVGDDLDTDPQWSTSGQWSFGIPAGLGGEQYGYPDPTSGTTGDNVYGVNLDGDYATTVGGPYYLIAGPFDLTGYYETELQFASWLNSDIADYVIHDLQISTDGTNWTYLWIQSGRDDLLADEWSNVNIDISFIADDIGSVYFRWGYQIIENRAYPYSGWNIDDFKINGILK